MSKMNGKVFFFFRKSCKPEFWWVFVRYIYTIHSLRNVIQNGKDDFVHLKGN